MLFINEKFPQETLTGN